MSSPTNQVQLTIVEDTLGELIVLEAPAAQIAIGPQLSDTTPVALGTAAAGTASSAARGDHVHAHGNLAGGSFHALASTSAAGFMSAAQFDLIAAATDDDDASTLVKRDSLGDFSAGTITADLTGTASAIADNTVTSAKIVDGSIVDADINASAEIAVSKLADGSARQLLQTDAAGTGVEWASNIDIPGTLDVTGAATFDGAVTVQGDLTINGTETIINTQTLEVEDKNIELGVVATPTDTTADGGGITLKGATDKTINWVDATDAWTLSEHVDLASTKEYRIASAKVLDATSLGSAVVTSSLTSVGTIGTGVWEGTAIDKTYLDATLVSTGDTGTVTSTMIADGTIVDADVNANAAIVDTKLATIATAGKVSNSATTADSANTVSAIVARDASGNFSAGTITAALTGNADTATKLSSTRTFAVTGDITGTVSSDLTAGASIATSIAAGVIVDADVNASAAIALSKLATGALPTAITVASANIVDGTIVNADINASAAIAGTKISPNFGGQTITTTGVISTGKVSLTGDIEFSRTNPAAITVDVGGNITLSADSSNTSAASAINFNVDGLEAADINNGGTLRFNTADFAGAGVCSQSASGLLRLGGGANAQNNGINVTLSGPDDPGSNAGVLVRDSTTTIYRWNRASDFHAWSTGGSERLHLTAAGTVRVTAVLSAANTTSNTSPTNSNASTTATASSLLNGIRTGTPTAGIDLQVPTGTNMDAAFADLQNNQAFEWSVINLAAATHTITVTANDNHTVVGNMIVAAASSGRFLTRKTATNTFITYRIA